MKLPPLNEGRLIKRYKRFLADVEFESGIEKVVITKNGNNGRRRRYSFFVSPIKSPQFLKILASSRDIVSWVLYSERSIANPIATSAAAIAIAIAVNTHPSTSP